MTKARPVRDEARPPIHLSDVECDSLYALALSAAARNPERSAQLIEELDRADVVPAASLPADVVTMHSRVSFVDEANGATREVTLVYPQEADIAAGKLSILSPVGVGLIGMAAGKSILWPDREGHERALRIVRVEQPSGAGGEAPLAAA